MPPKRKGPPYSATKYRMGEIKTGNDGETWEVIRSGSTKRWTRVVDKGDRLLYSSYAKWKKSKKKSKRRPGKKTVKRRPGKKTTKRKVIKRRPRKHTGTKMCEQGICYRIPLKMSKAKGRKAPQASATNFPIGYVRRGNDGKTWKVIRSGGSRRWAHV